MKKLLLIILVTLCSTLSFAQKVFGFTDTYTPSSTNGYVWTVPLKAGFRNCAGDIVLLVGFSKQEAQHKGYKYEGKIYTANQLPADAFKKAKGSFDATHMMADIYHGSYKLGTAKLEYVIGNFAGCYGETYDVLKQLGKSSADYKDKIDELIVRNLRFSKISCEDYHANSVIKEYFKQKEVDQKLREADSYFNGKDYTNAERLYKEVKKLDYSNEHANEKLNEIKEVNKQAEVKEKFNSYIQNGDNYFRQKNFDGAIQEYRKALNTGYNDATAQGKINDASQQKQIIKEKEAAALKAKTNATNSQSSNYANSSTSSSIGGASSSMSTSKSVKDHIQDGNAQIQNDPEKALQSYKMALAKSPNDPSLKSYVSKLENRINQKKESDRYRMAQQERAAEIARKQKEERDRQYAKIQADIKQSQTNMRNMEIASQKASAQVASGDFIGAGQSIGMEFARQGNVNGAVASMGIGIGLQVLSDNAEAKRKREEAERRRRAEEQRRREEARRQRELLEKQKREFQTMVAEVRSFNKQIVSSREAYLKQEINYTKTYDIFSDDGKPIYFFFVKSPKNYNYYKEDIQFPDKINIDIKKTTTLTFSPIIAVYPNTSGEFPFLKQILQEIKKKYVKDDTNSIIKIFNWTRTQEDIEYLYSLSAERAITANFQLEYPKGEMLIFLNDYNESDLDYWLKNDSLPEQKVSASNKKIDYWGNSSIDAIPTSEEATPKTEKNAKTKKIDYWGN